MDSFFRFSLLALVASVLACGRAGAREAVETNVAPLLQRRCGQCHGAEKQESGLRLDRVRDIRLTDVDGHVVQSLLS